MRDSYRRLFHLHDWLRPLCSICGCRVLAHGREIYLYLRTHLSGVRLRGRIVCAKSGAVVAVHWAARCAWCRINRNGTCGCDGQALVPNASDYVLGVAYAGLGAGVLFMAPLAQALIEYLGWRVSYLYVAAITLILVPFVALLPWSRIVGSTSVPSAAEPRGDVEWTLARTARTLPFWGLFVAFFANSCGIFIFLPQIVAYFIAAGFTPLHSATAFGAIGVLSTAGMIRVAWAREDYGRILVVSLSYASSAIGILLFWGLSFDASGALLVVGLIICGVPNGCRAPII